MIYRFANARSLGLAGIIIFGALLVDLLTDEVVGLSLIPLQTFHPHGVLRAFPDEWHAALLSQMSLWGFELVYAVVLFLGMVGYGPRLAVGLAAAMGTIWFHGLARSFGGHVNHQELIMLHSLCLIMFFPMFDGLSIKSWLNPGRTPVRSSGAYVTPLVLVCFFLSFSYYMVGVARVTASDIAVYFTNTMPHFAAEYSLKWNYWDISWGKYVLDHPWFAFLLKLSFPGATLLELVSPLAVFWRGFRRPWLVAMVIFHLLIWPLLNIFFWQHLLLLVLFAEPLSNAPTKLPKVQLLGASESLLRGLKRIMRAQFSHDANTAIVIAASDPKSAMEWQRLARQVAPFSDLGELLSILPERMGGYLFRWLVRLACLAPTRRTERNQIAAA